MRFKKHGERGRLIKILMAWMAVYGSLILFVHISSHTGKDDPLPIGNDGADRVAVAGAKARGEGSSCHSADRVAPPSACPINDVAPGNDD